MNILQALQRLRDDLKLWVTNNFNALNEKIDKKTFPVDNELDSSSTNPVQNRVITNAINNIPRFSGDYNDLTNAPDISEDDSGNLLIADEDGNVIFKADADGIHTTAVTLNGEAAATESFVEDAIANIDFPKTNLTDYYRKDEVDGAIESAKTEISESIVADADEWIITDDTGNIITRVDENGLETTTVNAQAVVIGGTDVASKLNDTDAHIQNVGVHVSSAEKAAWNSKSDFSGNYSDLSGIPVDIATTDYVDTAVANLVNAAPEALDTLEELAAALGNDENFATTMTNAIAEKAKQEDLDAHTGDTSAHVTSADKSKWNAKSDFSGSYEDLTDAPSISEDESGDLVITDDDGNIIFRSDENGMETTTIVAQNIILDGTSIHEYIQAQIQAAVSGLLTRSEMENYVSETFLGGEW